MPLWNQTVMKKSYVTTMPDNIGAFLKASQCFASLGINITRVSYNKAVDTHTLFIDAEGTEEQLLKADEELRGIGYLHSTSGERTVLLMEFILRDEPGSVTRVLELIMEFGFNISYISSQEDGTAYQRFKMGLFVEDTDKVSQFIARASELCTVNILDYNSSNVVYDNSIFYSSFVSGISRSMDISEEKREDLLVNCNMAMQLLDEKGLSPYHTFDSIGKLAELLIKCRGPAFSPRVTRHRFSERSEIIVIEPPCGSNTTIIVSDGQVLFVDTGYACYREETLKVIREILPDFDSMAKRVLISHADLDHIGLCPVFDEVLASENSALCMREEYEGRDGFRETNPLHKPYIGICKILTGYEPVPTDKVRVMWKARPENDVPLYPVGFLDVGEFSFEVYEGRGGHLKGEIVLIDYRMKAAFTGDIYVNMHGMSAEQAEYNRYAPILMTSVDTDPEMCRQERAALMQRLGAGRWSIFSGHGGVKSYDVTSPKE
ncbi:Zn-dependent hydrolase, including glyoxylase [Thermoplasmatales archaeon BRNA1]|nr:Zn-dependent hydrolase, including glyoxylase [Thermoplasmatales archaeon BRNA1]